jgi:hypothetical protein
MMVEHNPEFVKGVLQSIARARRLHDIVASTDAPTVSLEREDIVAILEMHLLLGGYALGVEGQRKFDL